jgi:hypothetical protein
VPFLLRVRPLLMKWLNDAKDLIILAHIPLGNTSGTLLAVQISTPAPDNLRPTYTRHQQYAYLYCRLLVHKLYAVIK